jgi:hypothetical protein
MRAAVTATTRNLHRIPGWMEPRTTYRWTAAPCIAVDALGQLAVVAE